MNCQFDYDMLKLLSNPANTKPKANKNYNDNVLYNEIAYKYKKYKFTKKKFDNIIKLIDNYLYEQEKLETIEDILNIIIENVIYDNRCHKNNDETRNTRTLRKSYRNNNDK